MASLQKRLAAKVLKVGLDKVWLDPTKKDEIEKAITKADIRRLIKKGYIKKKKTVKKKKGKKKKRQGPGSRKGKATAKVSRKRKWINTVRPLRRYLRKLKDKGVLTSKDYRKLRLLVKGGMFRSVSHLKFYLKQQDILKSDENG